MDQGFIVLLTACAVFAGSHFVLSHPLRRLLTRTLGERMFLLLYSVVAIASLAWVSHAFAKAPRTPPLWDGMAPLAWWIASGLTVIALALVLASLVGNPALPQAHIAGLSTRRPWGPFLVTRHPMMMGFALWAVSHVIISPTVRNFILCFTIAFVALVGSYLQDRKKLALNHREWSVWKHRTSFWPRLNHLGALGTTWLVALIAWVGVTGLHLWLAGIPAGIWRWVG